MSGEVLYERYKDALKRGHVASLRGRLEEALDAYAEAASIAPERSTPHTSAGTALLRRKRAADALRYYTVALQLSSRDEAALLGRAQTLAALDRRPEAADAFDALAESRAEAGKLADAVDAARRGLELAEGRDRRRTLERLIARLRASEPGEPGRIALERALLVLEGRAVAPDGAAHAGTAAAHAATIDEAAQARPADTAATGETMPVAVAGDSPGAGAAVDPEATAAPPPEARVPAPPVSGDEPGAAVPEPPAPVPYRRALDRDLDPAVGVAALALLAEDAVDAGDPGPALERLMDLAAAYRRDGHIDGALDACYLALSMDPDDTGLHLALVELYDERGWATLAVEKLDLVAALADLDGGAEAIRRVAAARSDRA